MKCVDTNFLIIIWHRLSQLQLNVMWSNMDIWACGLHHVIPKWILWQKYSLIIFSQHKVCVENTKFPIPCYHNAFSINYIFCGNYKLVIILLRVKIWYLVFPWNFLSKSKDAYIVCVNSVLTWVQFRKPSSLESW